MLVLEASKKLSFMPEHDNDDDDNVVDDVDKDDDDDLRGSTLKPSAKETRPWGKLCIESQLITSQSSLLSL